MARRDLADLVLLAAIWGGSFLLMRITGPAFGAVTLIALRVGIAAMVLLPVLAWQGGLHVMRERAAALAFVGFTNSALPFTLYAWALATLPAGFAAVANASSPLWAALVAYLWLRDRLSPSAVLGLVLGFAGVAVLSWNKASFDADGAGWQVLACVGATLSYGVAANFTKRHLAGVAPLAVATASQLFAASMLLPFAIAWWPSQLPGAGIWTAVLTLAVLCTGFAYFLYFRLIARVGPARAISVTFMVPLFGMLWGAWLGDERITWQMLAGCAIILMGTALANGLLAVGTRRKLAGDDGVPSIVCQPPEDIMEAPVHSMTNLFAQLGLPNDEASIARFIETHRPLPESVRLSDAPFWSASQAAFLREEIQEDADWAPIIDELNAELHG